MRDVRQRLSGEKPPSAEGDAVAEVKFAPGAAATGIQIGEDVSSLIFLHASEKPAANDFAYKYIYNFDDTAALLGHYEILYEDGFVTTVPIRYGVNILERTWNHAQNCALIVMEPAPTEAETERILPPSGQPAFRQSDQAGCSQTVAAPSGPCALERD
jgi:hypothetical protein